MLNIVQASKYESETISIIISFADVISAGDSITGVPVITPTVATGVDTNPSSILYEGVSVINGTAVEQRIRLGIPGAIYSILFTVATAAGDTLEKECYLAILPNTDSAVPNWLPLWESTQLYPIQATENIWGTSLLLSGTLQVIVIPYSYEESTQGTSSLFTGILHVVALPYSYSYEATQGSIVFNSGTLQVVIITYAYEEDLKGNAAFLSGTLQVVIITYNYSYEAIQGSSSFTSGTLT